MKPDRSIHEFLAEAEDILAAANLSLTALDSAVASGKSDPDQVNALFRAVHSFKGLAGLFGLKEPLGLSHKLEFLLDALRLGKADLDRAAIDALTQTTSLLGRLVRQAAGTGGFEDITAACERIDDLLKPKPAASTERPLAGQINLDPGILQVLTEYEEHRLRECVRLRKNLFLIRADFDLAGFETGLKDLHAALKKYGEVVSTLPTAGASGIGFSIVTGTQEARETLALAITTPNVNIEAISYTDRRKTDEPRPGGDGETIKSVSNTVRVDIYKLDGLLNLVGEMHLIKNAIARITGELRAMQGFTGMSVDLHRAQRSLVRRLGELQEGILEVRMVPIGQIFTRLSQAVRKYARDVGKEIDLEMRGEETELDKLMIEDLADPLMHLIRNAVDHGIESPEERRRLGKPEKGNIMLSAFPRGNHIVVRVEDDGAGIDAARIAAAAVEKGLLAPNHGLDPREDRRELLDLIFLPGFTTRETVTEISGRGVGMDVVKRNVARLSGMIDIETEPGEGAVFSVTLPVTLAIIKALIVESGGRTFAIPLSSVLEIQRATAGQLETIEGREVMAVREDTIPLLRVSRVFNLPERPGRDVFYVVLVGLAERRLGIIVDGLRDQQEIVIKPLGKRLSGIPGISGATELGDQRGVVLVLDIESLVESSVTKAGAKTER